MHPDELPYDPRHTFVPLRDGSIYSLSGDHARQTIPNLRHRVAVGLAELRYDLDSLLDRHWIDVLDAPCNDLTQQLAGLVDLISAREVIRVGRHGSIVACLDDEEEG